MQNVCLSVYDPGRGTGIFTELHEFIHYEHLQMDIIDSVLNKIPCIVYVSSARMAIQLINLVKAKGISPIPMTTLVTSEFCRKSGDMDKCISDIESSIFVVASNVLSCGVSFEQQDMFDRAYAVFEFSPNTPPLSPVIQLCGRVRSITSKTLRYTVIAKGCRPNEVDNTQRVFTLRGEELRPSPTCIAFHKLNTDEYNDHINMCKQRGYAAPCVREALVAAFTHTKDHTTAPLPPKYTAVEQRTKPSSLPTSMEKKRYKNMFNDLPRETTYTLCSETKRPIMVTRNDLPRVAYHQAPNTVELAEIERKDGTLLSDIVEPIPSYEPLHKKKRESLTDVFDPELTKFDDIEQESDDELEYTGDI